MYVNSGVILLSPVLYPGFEKLIIFADLEKTGFHVVLKYLYLRSECLSCGKIQIILKTKAVSEMVSRHFREDGYRDGAIVPT